MIAHDRRAQAPCEDRAGACTTPAKCEGASSLWPNSVRSLGRLPDAFGSRRRPTRATMKTVAEQGQDLDEALLGTSPRASAARPGLGRPHVGRELGETRSPETGTGRDAQRVDHRMGMSGSARSQSRRPTGCGQPRSRRFVAASGRRVGSSRPAKPLLPSIAPSTRHETPATRRRLQCRRTVARDDVSWWNPLARSGRPVVTRH